MAHVGGGAAAPGPKLAAAPLTKGRNARRRAAGSAAGGPETLLDDLRQDLAKVVAAIELNEASLAGAHEALHLLVEAESPKTLGLSEEGLLLKMYFSAIKAVVLQRRGENLWQHRGLVAVSIHAHSNPAYSEPQAADGRGIALKIIFDQWRVYQAYLKLSRPSKRKFVRARQQVSDICYGTDDILASFHEATEVPHVDVLEAGGADATGDGVSLLTDDDASRATQRRASAPFALRSGAAARRPRRRRASEAPRSLGAPLPGAGAARALPPLRLSAAQVSVKCATLRYALALHHRLARATPAPAYGVPTPRPRPQNPRRVQSDAALKSICAFAAALAAADHGADEGRSPAQLASSAPLPRRPPLAATSPVARHRRLRKAPSPALGPHSPLRAAPAGGP
ncbi:hypothetical protein M885DRAFT_626248 [Pelagophyceae sp. CCMP2097]|nr:hypothetical protein M885DRAFT_626248 [Pelagophyceae sp. CCMP2097]